MITFTPKANYRNSLLAILSFICMSGIGFSQTQTVTYSTPGLNSWVAPCGVTSITVECWGGGGSGGGATGNPSAGGGGAGGGYVRTIYSVIPGNTYTLFVGRGGYGSTNNGENGKDTYFGSSTTILAKGGNGGSRANSNGSSGNGGAMIATGNIGTVSYYGGGGGHGGSGGSYGGGGGSSAGTGSNGNTSSGIGGAAAVTGGGAGVSGSTGSGNGADNTNLGGGGAGARAGANRDWNGGDGGNGQIIITYTGIASYCIPDFTADVEPITLVQFAGINNATSNVVNGTPKVEAFCSPIMANVTQGNTYPITIKGNTAGFWTDYIKVFIDWNQNGALDPGEAVQLGTITRSTGLDAVTLTGNITVPVTATPGITRMRVIKNFSGYGNACDQDYDYGQAEDYLVNVMVNCSPPTGATANDNAGPLTVCTGTQVTLKQIGGALGTGQSWKWYAGGCGSGTAINTNTNADASYTFTPAVGTTTYFVRAEGGSCGTGACASVTVTVNNSGTITVASGSKDFTACLGINNPSYVSFNLGGGATGVNITGLPPGLTYNNTGSPVVISGTPSSTGTYNYIITPTGNSPCANPNIQGSITVSQAPTSVTYTTPVTYCSGALITPNTPAIGLGSGIPTNYIVSGIPLPTGLSLDAITGIISGTPTVVSPFTNYTITASNSCGSINTIVRIRISNGDNVYNVTPNGSQTFCSDSFTGVVIGLDNSDNGVTYNLIRDGSTTVATVNSTGGAFNFGNQTIAGTYTVTTNSTCKTNMNGSFTINITTAPNTTFSYPQYNYCSQGLSDAATFSGSPATGTFSASPSGLVFSDNTTGVVDLAASTPGTYSIVYTIAASGGCGVYTSPAKSFTIDAAPQVFDVYGGGGYCAGGSGIEIGLVNSETGVDYQLFRNGSILVTTVSGTGSLLSFGDQTVAGTYTVIAVKSPCNATMNGNAVVTIIPVPSPITISPSSATICQGTVQALTASIDPPTTSNGSITLSSGNINLSIPDNNATGISSLIKFTGIPIGATITSVSINFNISHTYDGDLLLNLKGPNGNVLNIANGIGGSGNNFTNTTVASNAVTNISFGSPPYTNTYLPMATNGVIGANIIPSNISNVTNFSGLYGSNAISVNGNWTFSVRDKSATDVGTLNNWSITINYTYVSNIINVAWSPATDLFSDQGGSIAYISDDSLSTVYSKPSTYGNMTYTATFSNEFGCSVSATSDLTVNQSPQLTMKADYCSRSINNQVVVTATSDVNVDINSWQWTGGLTVFNKSVTYSEIRPNTAATYYVTANSAANGCPATGSMSVAEELVTNGDFELGNTGFTSGYTYHADLPGLVPAGQGELYDDSGTNGYGVGTFGSNYHINFWGVDHTFGNGTGNYMVINGHGNILIWSETVTVLPNTDYYFSAYAVSLNNVPPFANLQFRVNGVPVGTSTGTLPPKSSDNNPGTWYRFYSNPTWNSGSATTATIEIIDLEPALGGNDFGLDDISFGTLSTFLRLTSAPATQNQTFACNNLPITPITYEVGGDGSQPNVLGLPTGLSIYWNGRDLRITGTPTQSGNFKYYVKSTGCNQKIDSGTIIIPAASFAGNFAGPTQSACYNDNGAVSVSGSVGNILAWQSSSDSLSWTNISNTTTSQGYSNIQTPIYYRAIAQNGSGCSIDTSLPVKVTIHNLWAGKSSNNWNTANNWSDNLVADLNCGTVTIPSGTLYSPVLDADVTVPNLNIVSGAHLELNGQTLTINGSYLGSGTLTGSNSSGVIISGNAGTLHFTPNVFPGNINNNYLKTFTLQNGANATLGDSLNITAGSAFGTLTVNNGAVLNTNGVLTLKSDKDGDARVGSSFGTITGNVTVERYFPSRRAWRFVSVPFDPASSGQTINQAWQEGNTNTTLDCPPQYPGTPGYGTAITFNGTNGYDLNITQNPSIKVWVNNAWTQPSSTYIPLNSYPAYCLFVRGDRTLCLSQGVYAGSNITTLRPRGVLNEKGISNNQVIQSYNDAMGNFIFMGNPYASSVQLTNAFFNNSTGILKNQFWVWDPKISGVNNVGGYVAYNNGVMAPLGGSYAAPTRVIESGQGVMFMRDSISSNADLTFNQSDKIDTQRNVFGKQKPVPYPVLYANILNSTDSNNLLLADGVAAAFNNKFSAGVDQNDAKKLFNFDENLELIRDDNKLAIEFRPVPLLSDTLFLKMYLAYHPYSLQVYTQNFAGLPALRAWLVDKYLNTYTELNLDGNSNYYNFSPVKNMDGSMDTTSYRNRFIIVFHRQFNADTVPVTKVIDQNNPNETGNANSIAATGGKLMLYPNPVSKNKVSIQFNNMPKGSYELTVFNIKGQKLAIREMIHNGGVASYEMPLDASWANGVYTISIMNEETKIKTNLKLIISK